MPDTTIIQAIRITTDATETDEDIGLYSGVLRWSEATLSGVSDTWNADMLSDGGIPAIVQSGDFRRGGGLVDNDGVTLSVRNTTQESLRIAELCGSLVGYTCEIVEFIGTEADSDATSSDTVYTGVVESVTWDEVEMRIAVKSSLKLKRQAQIGTDGYPVTFGEYHSGRYAKFNRVTEVKNTLTNNDIFAGTWSPVTTIFPITTKTSDTEYKLTLSEGFPGGGFSIVAPSTATFITVVLGTGANQTRQILFWTLTDNILTVQLDSCFGTELTLSGANQSWVKIQELQFDFYGDTFNCYGFLGTDGSQSNTPNLYVYDDDKYNPIPRYAYDAGSGSTKAKVSLQKHLFENDPEDITSFFIQPVENVALYNDFDLGDWGYASYTKEYAGQYKTAGFFAQFTPTGSLSNITDKDSTTSYQIASDGNVTAEVRYALSFTLPEIPENITFDKVYIGIKARTNYLTGFLMKYRRFYGDSILIGDIGMSGAYTFDTESLPDFYFSDAPANDDYYFYRTNADALVDGRKLTSGYKVSSGDFKFEIANITDRDMYNSIRECALIFYHSATVASTIDVYEIAVVLESSASVKSELYLPFAGRKYNSDWGHGEAPGNVIENPVAVIEHCLRLQNWSENSTTSVGWGKDYGTNALIKTSGVGSFDDSKLDTVKAFSIARQFFNLNDTWTDEIVRGLCSDFYLVNRQNASGYECLEYLLDTTSTTDSIDYADIIGEIGEIVEPDPSDIFCEPYLDYNWDEASGEFKNRLEIKNITAASFSASCHSGFTTESDAQGIWNTCVTAWQRTRSIEKMPVDLAEQKWIYSESVAVWKLQKIVTWMTKRRTTFAIPYSIGRSWYVGKRIDITLPHQTDNGAVKCVIERIEKDKGNDTCNLQVILLDDISTAFYS